MEEETVWSRELQDFQILNFVSEIGFNFELSDPTKKRLLKREHYIIRITILVMKKCLEILAVVIASKIIVTTLKFIFSCKG